MKHDSATLSLFDEPASTSAQEELQRWFDAWLADGQGTGRLRRDSSQEVYRAMWGGFIEWCLAQQPTVRLLGISKEDLRLFIASRDGHLEHGELTSRYTWRLLNLIDRVLRFATQMGGVHGNDAAAQLIGESPEVRHANISDRALPDYLPVDEARCLVTYLSRSIPRGANVVVPRAWHELRNRAAVGLQLGGGLTPGDVRALTLGGVIEVGGPIQGVPWKLVVPADGNTPERETPVAQWAGQLLRYWLEVRAELKIPGPWVFPSTGTGKQWAKGPQYRSVGEVLTQAGVEQVKGGSFRLRHTFALRQLRRGKKPEDVARWMGIANVAEMDRYARVLTEPVDVA
jgi:integrase